MSLKVENFGNYMLFLEVTAQGIGFVVIKVYHRGVLSHTGASNYLGPLPEME